MGDESGNCASSGGNSPQYTSRWLVAKAKVYENPVWEKHWWGRGVLTAERTIAGAALDVWYNYAPAKGGRLLPASRPFHELDNVIMTPHDSGITEETFRRRAEEVAENINRFVQNRPLSNVVYPKNYSGGDRQ